MRIGIDGGCLANRRGFGRFARELLDALAVDPQAVEHEFVVFVDCPSLEVVSVPERFETVAVSVREAPSRAASARGNRRVRDLLAMGQAVARSHLDLIFFPATYSFFPVWNVPRVVVTMHDTLALTHPELVFPTRRGRLLWKAKEHAAVLWADRVVTVSEASKRDLIAWFRLPPERVRVIPEGPDAVFRPQGDDAEADATLARYGVAPGSRFLLYVGGFSPHKNLLKLIEAFAWNAPDDVALVLVGDTTGDVFHTHVPAVRAAVTRFGLGDRVVFTGFVPDDALAHFYRKSYALVQPSLLEGFGLPAVEAMACGTPVICSTAGSLPEVVGQAGVLFDPTNVRAIGQALRRLLDDPRLRSRLSDLALRQARRFTWEASARALLDCFEELAPRTRIRSRRSA